MQVHYFILSIFGPCTADCDPLYSGLTEGFADVTLFHMCRSTWFTEIISYQSVTCLMMNWLFWLVTEMCKFYNN